MRLDFCLLRYLECYKRTFLIKLGMIREKAAPIRFPNLPFKHLGQDRQDVPEVFFKFFCFIGDLFRVSDLMFMPSHREGFAMPVLEAGLAGIPVVSTAVPAALEIGGEDVILFDEDQDPGQLAGRILTWAERSPVHRLRRRVRQSYTWPAIFHRYIEPLLRAQEDG